MSKDRFGHKIFNHRYQTGQMSGVSKIQVLYSSWYDFHITAEGLLTDANGNNPRTPEIILGKNRRWKEI